MRSSLVAEVAAVKGAEHSLGRAPERVLSFLKGGGKDKEQILPRFGILSLNLALGGISP